jgi:hypothetical protein
MSFKLPLFYLFKNLYLYPAAHTTRTGAGTYVYVLFSTGQHCIVVRGGRAEHAFAAVSFTVNVWVGDAAQVQPHATWSDHLRIHVIIFL